MELHDLVGEEGQRHVLSALEMDPGADGPGSVAFTLDGTTYRVVEDEDDGYRSYVKDVEVCASPLPPVNQFPPQAVTLRWNTVGIEEFDWDAELLEFIAVATGELVLRIGTSNTGDYYPYWVADYRPQNFSE